MWPVNINMFSRSNESLTNPEQCSWDYGISWFTPRLSIFGPNQSVISNCLRRTLVKTLKPRQLLFVGFLVNKSRYYSATFEPLNSSWLIQNQQSFPWPASDLHSVIDTSQQVGRHPWQWTGQSETHPTRRVVYGVCLASEGCSACV